MAKRSSATFAKRQREMARRDKRQQKLERRQERQKQKEEREAAGVGGAPILELGPDGEYINPLTQEVVQVGAVDPDAIVESETDDEDEEATGTKPTADPTKAKPAKPPAGPVEEDVLELTEVVGSGEAESTAPPALEANAGEFDLELEEDDDEPAPVAAPPRPAAAPPPDREQGLVSAPVASASTSATCPSRFSCRQRSRPSATTVSVASTPIIRPTPRNRTRNRMPAPLQQQRSTPCIPRPIPARSARSIDERKPPMWICWPITSSQSWPSAPP